MFEKTKNLVVFLASLLTLVLKPYVASGQIGTSPTPIQGFNVDSLWGLLDEAFLFLYTLFFALAAFFILWAAFLYLTAAGDEEKIGKAKSILVYSLIAVVIAVVSLGLADVVGELVISSLSGTP